MVERIRLTDEQRRGMHRRAVAKARHDRAVHYGAVEVPEPVVTLKRKGTRCKELSGGWLSRTAQQARQMVDVLSSPIIPEEASEARMAHCRVCEHATETVAGLHYCECCGCPHVAYASLESKTRHAAFECAREPQAFGVYVGVVVGGRLAVVDGVSGAEG